jgi:hypothetical protein
MKEKQEHHFNLRIPSAIWKDLEQMAEDEERSINGEIVKAIREHLKRNQKGKAGHEQEKEN